MKLLRRTIRVTYFSSSFVLTVLACKERMLLRSQSPNPCQLFLFRHALQYGQTILQKAVVKNLFLKFQNRKTHESLFTDIFDNV